MKKDKHIDYREVISAQEKKSHKLTQDRETDPETRKENMIKRTLKLREGE